MYMGDFSIWVSKKTASMNKYKTIIWKINFMNEKKNDNFEKQLTFKFIITLNTSKVYVDCISMGYHKRDIIPVHLLIG